MSYKCAQEPNDRVEAELDEEFEQLLNQSSLGTPTAQAYQALTPGWVHRRLRERLQGHNHSENVTPEGPDTDEVVLEVVRCAARDGLVDREPPWGEIATSDGNEGEDGAHRRVQIRRSMSIAAYQISCRDMVAFTRHLRLSAHVPRYRHWVVMVLNEMVLQGVFVDLRPDVARSIVEIGFDRTDDEAPLALMMACSTAVSSTLIADEVINSTSAVLIAGAPHLMATKWPSDPSATSRRAAPTSINVHLARFFLRPSGTGGWKMIERGPRDVPRQALMRGKSQPERLLPHAAQPRAGRSAVRRQIRRQRSTRQRGNRRHVAARPPAAPRASTSWTRTERIAVEWWTGRLCLVATSTMGVLLVGILTLLTHYLR